MTLSLGDVFEDMMRSTDSSTVVFRTLFEDRFVTTEPDHIKVSILGMFVSSIGTYLLMLEYQAMLTLQFENFGTSPSSMKGLPALMMKS